MPAPLDPRQPAFHKSGGFGSTREILRGRCRRRTSSCCTRELRPGTGETWMDGSKPLTQRFSGTQAWCGWTAVHIRATTGCGGSGPTPTPASTNWCRSIEEVRDLGEVVVGLGRLRARSKERCPARYGVRHSPPLPQRPCRVGQRLVQLQRSPRSRRAVGVAGLGPARRRLPAAFLGQLLDPCVDLGRRLLQPLHL